MSLLTPLYVAGLLAVSLPLVFHLIRRMPRGEVTFSTLMFLGPSPPRLTRRSRLDQLWLLLLRVLALSLIAIAFARPFLRRAALLHSEELPSRRIAVLVDTSASMRRGDLWQQAAAKVEEVLGQLRPGDDVGLFAFDSEFEVLVGFDDSTAAPPEQQASRVRTALKATAPSWAASDLGRALVSAAEELVRAGGDRAGTTRQIVLLGDLQQGCRTDTLQTYKWPDDVQLVVHTVSPSDPTNAGVHLAADSQADVLSQGEPSVRVRVTNARDSQTEQFELGWTDPQNDAATGQTISIHVPPGESRIVRVPRPAENLATEQLSLTGDAEPFDNTIYVVPQEQKQVRVIYIGSEEATDPQRMLYYAQRAFPETPRRKVDVAVQKPEDPLPTEDLSAVPLTIVTAALPERSSAQLRQYLSGGGTVLYVLAGDADNDAAKALGEIMGLGELNVAAAGADDYAMLGELDFSHPLFAPFADPRYNDFTKIRFWKHCRVDVEGIDGVRVLTRFDNGDPALFERVQSKGRLLVLTSGWHPADSQLARCSKFVPLLGGMLDATDAADTLRAEYQIGEPVVLPNEYLQLEASSVRRPDGSQIKIARDARCFVETDQPGIYRLSAGEKQRDFAVNLSVDESKTAPLEAEQLESLGVEITDHRTQLELAEKRRQMRDVELENRQKLWHWLILAALAVLILETYLAGRLTQPAREPIGVAG